MKSSMKPFYFVPTLLLVLLTTGCVTRAMRQRQEQLCGNLATLNSAIATVRRLHSARSTTVESWQQAEERLQSAFETLKTSARAVRGADTELETLEKAYLELNQAVEDMAESLDPSTKAQIIAAIPDKVAAVESASIRAKSGLRCQ